MIYITGNTRGQFDNICNISYFLRISAVDTTFDEFVKSASSKCLIKNQGLTPLSNLDFITGGVLTMMSKHQNQFYKYPVIPFLFLFNSIFIKCTFGNVAISAKAISFVWNHTKVDFRYRCRKSKTKVRQCCRTLIFLLSNIMKWFAVNFAFNFCKFITVYWLWYSIFFRLRVSGKL